MELISAPTQLEMVLQMALALALGTLLGMDRLLAGRFLGMRAYGLISLSSCIFVILGVFMSSTYIAHFDVSPVPVIAALIITFGLFGVGLIMVNGRYLSGVSAAAYLLIAAGVGAVVGFGLYTFSIIATLLTLLTLFAWWHIEERFKKHSTEEPSHTEHTTTH